MTEDRVAASVLCGPDPAPLVETARAAAAAGVDHLYFHQIGPDQDGFFRFWQRHLRPALVVAGLGRP